MNGLKKRMQMKVVYQLLHSLNFNAVNRIYFIGTPFRGIVQLFRLENKISCNYIELGKGSPY